MALSQKVRESAAFIRDITMIGFFGLGIILLVLLILDVPPLITNVNATVTSANQTIQTLSTTATDAKTTLKKVDSAMDTLPTLLTAIASSRSDTTQTAPAFPHSPSGTAQFLLTGPLENQMNKAVDALSKGDWSQAASDIGQFSNMLQAIGYSTAATKAKALQTALENTDLQLAQQIAGELQSMFYKP